MISRLNRKSKKLAIGCFAIFAIWQLVLIIKYKGWYAFDETYHLFASNEYFSSVATYDRAPYINGLISMLTSVFGKSYMVYKMIPYTLGVFSIAIMLYVTYKTMKHNYSILIFTILVCCHSVVVFNHLCIRMYVFEEFVVSVLVLLLYRMSLSDNKKRKVVLIAMYIFVATALFWFCTWEASVRIMILVAIVALVSNELAKIVLPYVNEKKFQIPLIALIVLLIGLVVAFVIGYKLEIIRVSFSIPHMSKGVDYPWFLRHFYHGNILLLIALMLVGISLIYNKYDLSTNIIGIYLLTFLPFVIYGLAYFDNFVFRVYASYIVVMIFIATYWIDNMKQSVLNAIIVVFLLGYNLYKSQSDIDWRDYYEAPYIQWEAGLNNYGGMIGETQAAISDGRKCICLWNSYNDAALFSEVYDVATENYSIVNDRNKFTGEVTKEGLDNILDRMKNTDDRYIIMVAPHVDTLLGDASENESPYYPEYIDLLKDNFECKEFKANSFCGVFYVN